MAEYIKRQDAIDPFLVGKNTFAGFCTIEQAIENIESVEAADVVELRHGEWEDKPSGRYLHMASWCSVCGQKSGIGGIESNRHKPYCPNCGAKMDGKGEGE